MRWWIIQEIDWAGRKLVVSGSKAVVVSYFTKMSSTEMLAVS